MNHRIAVVAVGVSVGFSLLPTAAQALNFIYDPDNRVEKILGLDVEGQHLDATFHPDHQNDPFFFTSDEEGFFLENQAKALIAASAIRAALGDNSQTTGGERGDFVVPFHFAPSLAPLTTDSLLGTGPSSPVYSLGGVFVQGGNVTIGSLGSDTSSSLLPWTTFTFTPEGGTPSSNAPEPATIAGTLLAGWGLWNYKRKRAMATAQK